MPRVPGIPWWAAAIVAIVCTAIGVAADAGGEDALGGVFVAFYAFGCIAAVVAVRQSGVFTAVIQPPLILFVAVPFAYFVGHGSTYTGMKDTLINSGYPLIERFPLMFFTTAAVLLIGMVRWYLGAAARRAAPEASDAVDESPAETADAAPAKPTSPRRSTRTTTARAGRAAPAEALDDEPAPAPRRSARTRTDAPRASGAQRTAGTASGSRRSRHSLPPESETIEPVPERARRRSTPPTDTPVEPRRRSRTGEPRDREPRDREPRDRDRDPRDRRPLPPLERRSPADRAARAERAERPERYDRPQRRDRSDAQDRAERPQRRPRVADYDTFDPPPATRSAGNGTGRPNGNGHGNGNGGTHHPVSRVRYRGADDGESRVEQRTRPRPSRHAAPDSWE